MQVITVNQNIQGGLPCFAGTRVPVSSLFDHLKKGGIMRGVLAAIWGVIVCLIVVVVVGLAASLKFPPHTAENNLMRIAGLIIGVGLAINSYRKNSKPPSPPSDESSTRPPAE